MNLLPRWERHRYQLLDHMASRGTGGSASYVQLVARIEERLQPERRAVAVNRISQALGVSVQQAKIIYRNCLASEAREEADTARLRRSASPIAEAIDNTNQFSGLGGPCIYITLHWGSPMITFLYLRAALGIPVRIIGRPLDRENPLPPAKMLWGRHKVEWMEQMTGASFISDDGAGALEARAELLDGRSIFASVDVPAPTQARARVVDLFGEPIRIASGVLRLAALTQVPLVPILGYSRGNRIYVTQEEPFAAASEAEHSESVGLWIEQTLRRQPEEWWLWPFVNVASQ